MLVKTWLSLSPATSSGESAKTGHRWAIGEQLSSVPKVVSRSYISSVTRAVDSSCRTKMLLIFPERHSLPITSAFAPRWLQTLDFVTSMRHSDPITRPHAHSFVNRVTHLLGIISHYVLRLRSVRRFVSLTAGGSHNRTSRLHPLLFLFLFWWFVSLPGNESCVGTWSSKVGISFVRSMCETSNLLNSYVATLTDDSHTDETPLRRMPLFSRLLHYISKIMKITSNLSKDSESLSTHCDNVDPHFKRPRIICERRL